MQGITIKKKEQIKVLINGPSIPPYIARVADSLSEIAATTCNSKRDFSRKRNK